MTPRARAAIRPRRPRSTIAVTTPQYSSTWNAASALGVPVHRPSEPNRSGGTTNSPTAVHIVCQRLTIATMNRIPASTHDAMSSTSNRMAIARDVQTRTKSR
jgi:hypothetical protein